MALKRAKLGDRVKFSERKHRVGPRARRSCSCNFLSVCAGGSNRAIYAVGSIAHRTRPRRQKESPGRVLCHPQGQQQRLHRLPPARSRPYSSSHRRVCPKSGDGGNGRRTRSDLCWPALALLSLPSPHPRGRTPTAIPPVCLNARRSTTRQRPFRTGVIILLRIKLMALALRPVSAQTALVTITASGAIRGRNHCARRARLRPPSKRKTCLMSAQTALVTITASGAIRGRNHAKSAPVRSPAGSGRPFRARRRRCLAGLRRGRPGASVGLAGGVL